MTSGTNSGYESAEGEHASSFGIARGTTGTRSGYPGRVFIAHV